MNLLEKVVSHLHQKVKGININNPKANTGAVLIQISKDWEDKLEGYVKDVAFPLLQQQFSRSTTDSPAGTAKLTNISTVIGKHVIRAMNRSENPWAMEVRLGDLFIEAFKVADLVDVHRLMLSGNQQHYIVSATERWTALSDIPDILKRVPITGTSYKKPMPIKKNYQRILGQSYPLVKGDQVDVDISAPWVSAVDKLQSVAWRINRRVLDALQANKDLFISDEEILDNEAKEQKRRSKKVEWSFIISKAEKLREKDKFYQYLDADYRGRLYYIEPFLNFQGSDMARGLLKFARAKPMTQEGMQWLAIHTANSFNQSYSIDEIPKWTTVDYKSYLEGEGLEDISVDKMTLEDRIAWTNYNMDYIRHAGTKSIISTTAEKPVAYLAACIEWADIHDALNSHRIHMSHLPIPIDGSNNGWQHLGAISKDSNTGSLVGLIPVEIQQDFYVQTAKKLIEINDDLRLSGILSTMPMKHIRKGISKRGSMTRAYSAGQKRIAENMYFDCKAEDYHIDYGISEKDCYKLAGYLIKAIDEVCPGPLTTMSYLQQLAAFEIGRYTIKGPGTPKFYKQIKARRKSLIEKDELTDEEITELNNLSQLIEEFQYELTFGNGKDSLSWTTPSGFKVQYQNWVMKSHKVAGRLDGKYIKHVARLPSNRPDIRGFMCGVSPNFIHSMDATHMALVINKWKGEFGAVHDSFSTHASDVDDLLAITKDVFIDLYSVDNFYEYIKNTMISDQTDLKVKEPKRGDLNIGDINESDYFFS